MRGVNFGAPVDLKVDGYVMLKVDGGAMISTCRM
jgi:hypothetical protein